MLNEQIIFFPFVNKNSIEKAIYIEKCGYINATIFVGVGWVRQVLKFGKDCDIYMCIRLVGL